MPESLGNLDTYSTYCSHVLKLASYLWHFSKIERNSFLDGKKVVTVIPMHKEVKLGTLFGILELAKVSEEEFLRRL